MSIFKNNNEAAYVGGRKHWTDIIKNSGSGELLIWRQPEEDFNTNSTLIVMPGEQAIFIKDGIIEQVFDNGRYKLNTKNYPFISRLKNAFSGGVSTFNCVVYFIRKADSKELRWGTTSPIQVRDRVFGVRTSAKARGGYKVRIVNPEIFLTKLIGNNVSVQAQAELDSYFSSELQGKIKSAVSRFLNDLQQELIGIDAYLDELGDKIQPYIDSVLEEYGLQCVKFSLSGLDIDVSKYDDIDRAQIDYIIQNRRAQGDKAVMEILGDDWGRQQSANILGTLASNPGAGGAAAAGAGIGMGAAVGGVFGSMAQQMFRPMTSEQTTPYQQAPSGRFQQGTVTQANSSRQSEDDSVEVLSKLKKMLDLGLIEQEEYEIKKKEVLERM